MKRCNSLLFRSSSTRQTNRDSRKSSSSVTFMSPSSIHHIRSEHLFNNTVASCHGDNGFEADTAAGAPRLPLSPGTCYCCCCGDCNSPAIDRNTSDLILQASCSALSVRSTEDRATSSVEILGRELKIQAVENDGRWYALDSAQLELCRRLERRGLCRQVRVDVIPTREIPPRLRSLMTPPAVCCRAAADKQTAVHGLPPALNGERCLEQAVQRSSFPSTRIDVSQLASQHRDKLVASLPPTVVTISSTVAAAGSATTSRPPALSHVTKGYHKLEQDDNGASSNSGTDDEDASGSQADSTDGQPEKESDNELFDSDLDTTDDDEDDDDDTGSSDSDWTKNSNNDSSDGAPSDEDEKNCLL